jgi:hypothetical protein
VTGLKLDEVSARIMLKRLLNDRRNLTAFCFDDHMDGEAVAGSRRFTIEEVPPDAIEFAGELGVDLTRVYPPLTLIRPSV